jgi:hypothetical protein
MKVWLPSLDKKGDTLLELKNDFSFEYIESNIKDDVLEVTVVETGVLTDCRFQILFEIATIHLANGQYRDAVLAAHTALERYREFFILAEFIDQGFDSAIIKEFWSSMGNQSERQFGAYQAMMFLRSKSITQGLSSKHVKYRNKVVHQGFFPNAENTYKYCLATLKIIENGLTVLASNDNKILSKAMECEYIRRKVTEATIPISINPLLQFENLKNDGWVNSFNSRLDELKKIPFYEITWPNK